MRKGLILAAASVLVLSACSPAEKDSGIVTDEAAPAADAAADAAAFAPASGRTGRPELVPPPAPIAQIAYAYSYALSLPRDRGAETMSRHELECVAAGAGYCQVVSSEADWTARRPGGRLELRGQPEWINRFRSGLALDASNAGGRLDAARTVGEDVTRNIDAALTGARTTASLADRIKALQARRGGTLAQRLQIEQELSDLKRQQDEQQVELRALNDRVLSARLTIDYRQGGAFASNSPVRPVAQAMHDALGLSMGVLAILITAGSLLLPIGVIVAVTWWALRRRRRKTLATAPAA